ncbi:hypothetical protein [Desulfovibrio legallii]|uniref:hypothetical protein n=1 Tax=Desulfovibrio legallii TaxID=571438 RepID=UPI000E54CA96|nr:hypothetical protein [Desulfovibrio legallii]RHH25990.1 hypothetical protein DW219_00085 [Desulfovibrio sp. AM18-2]
MSYIKPRPHGFRAVRRLGKTEVVYCVEHDKQVDVFDADGWISLPIKAFRASYVREYSPMPDAVRVKFADQPSFEEWWAERAVARREEE